MQNSIHKYLYLFTNTVLGDSECSCSIETTYSCPISKLGTYSEFSWPCGSTKTIWGAIDAPNYYFFFLPTRHQWRAKETPPKAALSRVPTISHHLENSYSGLQAIFGLKNMDLLTIFQIKMGFFGYFPKKYGP